MGSIQFTATKPRPRLTHPAATLLAALVLIAGCGPGSGPVISLTSDDPAGRIPAMKQAALQKDASAVPELVKRLESDDPAERFYAIEALQRITGQTLGYIYYATEQDRAAAVARWKARIAPATKPED